MLIGVKAESYRLHSHTWGPCVQKTPHCQHQYVKCRWMRDMQKRQRLTEIPYSSGIGCCLSGDRHRSCVPQTPQAHLRAVCAEDTPLPALICKAVADARHAETPATDGNSLQFGHWAAIVFGCTSATPRIYFGYTSGILRLLRMILGMFFGDSFAVHQTCRNASD